MRISQLMEAFGAWRALYGDIDVEVPDFILEGFKEPEIGYNHRRMIMVIK